MGELVWILPRQSGHTDAHGNIVWDWPDPPESGESDTAAIPVPDAKVAPRTSPTNETPDPTREAVIVGLTVYLPPGTRMAAVDRMWVRDDIYHVIGEPGVWVNPWTGVEKGVQVALERTEG